MVMERFIAPCLSADGRVLEIGPGGGKFSRLIEPEVKELVLSDISESMLERAAESCARKPETVLLDGKSLQPLADASFDAVISFDVFIHLESEEIFRYFAEINRVLKPGGRFVVHTSNFESRFGFHSFLRMVRDHRNLIGQRYGGRMYPMSRRTVERFGENTGFRLRDSSGDWEDRDLIFSFQKTRGAIPWRFITEPRLMDDWEIVQRIGGSDERELYFAFDRQNDSLHVLLIAAKSDRHGAAVDKAELPDHPCLPKPVRTDVRGDLRLVVFPELRGPNLGEVLRDGLPRLDNPRELPNMMLGFLQAVDRAHRAGLVHGEIDAETPFLDVRRSYVVACGFVDPAKAGLKPDEARASDCRAVAELFRALPMDASLKAALDEPLAVLADGAMPTSAVDAIHLLIENPPS